MISPLFVDMVGNFRSALVLLVFSFRCAHPDEHLNEMQGMVELSNPPYHNNAGVPHRLL